MVKKLWWGLLAVAVLGCGTNTSPDTPENPDGWAAESLFGLTPPAAQDKLALTTLADASACEDLERSIEDTAVLEMRSSLESSWRYAVTSWQWYWRQRNAWAGGGLDAGSAGTGGSGGAGGSGGGAGSTAAAPGPTDYTTTNNQVAGVDEADFVKNDGTRIFVLSGRSLYTALSWPATAMSRQGKLDLEGYPHQMLKHSEHTLVVFSKVYLPELSTNTGDGDCADLYCLSYSANAVKVTVVDVSTLSQPRVVSSSYFPGRFQAARLIADSVRLVLSSDLRMPYDQLRHFDWAFQKYPTLESMRVAFLELGLHNETAIRSRSLEQWLPRDRHVVAGFTTTAPLDCKSVAVPNGSTELGLTSVVTLDLSRPGTVQRASLLARAGEVYASPTALYVASPHWWWGWGWWSGRPAEDTTYVHKFDLVDPGASRWLASGSVRGWLVDQFSMDEHQGYLRVASTRRDFSNTTGSSWWWNSATVSQVTVLGVSGQSLVKVGQSPDLAPGERIMSARFMADRGYVVTFRQVDPLFTFDLSNPTAPKLLGELKVEGFSSYLHPIDATHLLGIGTLNGSVQLALYDVSDMAAPRQTHRYTLATYSYSQAQWDHHAFNYFASQKRLAVPFSTWEYDASGIWSWSRFVSDLRVFDVDPSTGFTERGRLSVSDLFQQAGGYGWSYYWQPQVRRSIMADDFVYAIGDSGLRVANVADLSTPLATVNFDQVR